jgi:hypothetical protein
MSYRWLNKSFQQQATHLGEKHGLTQSLQRDFTRHHHGAFLLRRIKKHPA